MEDWQREQRMIVERSANKGRPTWHIWLRE